MSAALYGIKDGTGVMQLVLDFLTDPDDNVLPPDSLLVIKEPFCKIDVSGQVCVSVSHPSDLVVVETDAHGSPEGYQTAGNAASKVGKWKKAFELYSKGLAIVPNEDSPLKAVLLRNRALAALKLERFEDALKSALAAKETDPHTTDRNMLKAYLRAAQAAYELTKFADAFDYASRALDYQSDDEDGLAIYDRARKRLREEQSGDYDLGSMITMGTPRVDAASFLQRTVVKASKYGNGLFVAQTLQASDLILAEKALFAVFENESEGFSAVKARFMPGNEQTGVGLAKQAAGYKRFARRLFNNPELAASALKLHAGSYDSCYEPWRVVDGKPVIDLFHAHEVLSNNSFCIPAPPEVNKPTPQYPFKRGDNDTGRFGIGLWQQTSHCNHSCIPNAQVSLMGDLLILRAVHNIAEGEEIFVSYGSLPDYAARQAQFQNIWGFTCQCPLCTADSKTAPETTALRTTLANKPGDAFPKDSDKALKAAEQDIRDLAATFDPKLYKSLPRQEVADAYMRLFEVRAARQEGAAVEAAILSLLRELQIDIRRVNGSLNVMESSQRKWIATTQAIELLRGLAVFKQGMGKDKDAAKVETLAQEMYSMLNGTMDGYEVPAIAQKDD